jgi:uncharacterized protein
MSPALAAVLEKIRGAELPSFADVELTGPNDRSRTFGETPLHVVAVWGDANAARVLLDEGAVIDLPGEHGCTALHEAALHGHIEVVKLLLARGADRKLQGDFGSFSEIAGRSKSPELRKLATT